VDAAADGERADVLIATEAYDAVLLDLGLPKIDGLTLLRRWRDAGAPFPCSSDRAGSWHEKVQGIDSGADDYVAKPFQMEEYSRAPRADSAGQRQMTPELAADRLRSTPDRQVTRDGAPVKLTSHEFRVLSYLMHQAGASCRRANSPNTLRAGL